MTSRRRFMAWLGALAGSAGMRAPSAHALPPVLLEGDEPAGVLDAALLLALARVVLPSELGAEGVGRAAREFHGWLRAYRPGTEVLHAYGSGTLGRLPESQAQRWGSQLRSLNDAAQEQLGKSFGSASQAQREALVRRALAAERVPGLPSPLTAPHVALGLLGWFYASPGATDLCYRARIEKKGCRPLGDNPKEPAPIRDRPRASGGPS